MRKVCDQLALSFSSPRSTAEEDKLRPVQRLLKTSVRDERFDVCLTRFQILSGNPDQGSASRQVVTTILQSSGMGCCRMGRSGAGGAVEG